MVFFLDAGGKVYARYGARDGIDADRRQSLPGLRYTMQSVLEMHRSADKAFAPRSAEGPKFARSRFGFGPRGGRGCLHCHQVKEIQHSALKRAGTWSRDLIHRYPLPDNLGFELDVDRGNVVKAVKDGSPAAAGGLWAGDVVRRIDNVPIHSLADATFALDRAMKATELDVVWQRDGQIRTGKVQLPAGWRKSDISWRASLRELVPYGRLDGFDLGPQERKALGLSPTQLAFRQKQLVTTQARKAGVRGGDIILDVDGRKLAMGVDGFARYIQHNYVVGDRVTLNILRDGKRMDLLMTLEP